MVEYVLQIMTYVLAAVEKITVFVVRCISVTFWCLYYMRKS